MSEEIKKIEEVPGVEVPAGAEMPGTLLEENEVEELLSPEEFIDEELKTSEEE